MWLKVAAASWQLFNSPVLSHISLWPPTRLCCRATDWSLHVCNAAPYICVHVRSLAFRTQPGRDPVFIQSHFDCVLSGWCYNRNGSIYLIKKLCVWAASERFKSWSDKQPQNHFTIFEMINASLQDKNNIFPFFYMSLTSLFEAVFSSTHCFNIKLEHKQSICWCNLVASNHSQASDRKHKSQPTGNRDQTFSTYLILVLFFVVTA